MKSAIADKLKTLRKAKGMTQQDVADAIGISRGTIAGYEIGRRTPRFPDLQRLAELFGVGLDFFGVAATDDIFDVLTRAKDVFESDSVSQDDKDKLYKELMRLYLQLGSK